MRYNGKRVGMILGFITGLVFVVPDFLLCNWCSIQSNTFLNTWLPVVVNGSIVIVIIILWCFEIV